MKKQNNNTHDFPQKEKGFKRGKRMISSVVIAVIIWVLVVNVVNPEVTETVKGIPVNFVGESYLRDRGFVIVDKEELPEFSLKVNGTRRDLLNGMNRISVQVDVSSIDKSGKSVLPAQIYLPDNISVQKQKYFNVEVNVESRYEKTVPVVVEQTGDITRQNEGKIVCSVPDKKEIVVYGSAGDVEKIEKCLITVDVSDIKSDRKTVHEYTFIDDEGKPVEETSSAYSQSSVISVTNMVYERHTAKIEVEVNPELQRKFNVNYELKAPDNSSIDVGVAEGVEIPEKIKVIVPDGEYNKGKQVLELDFEEMPGVYIPFEKYYLEANLIPMKQENKNIEISLTNLPEGLVSNTDKIVVQRKVYVPEDLTGDLKAVVDCSGFVSGANSGKIKFENKAVIMVRPEDIGVDIKLNTKE